MSTNYFGLRRPVFFAELPPLAEPDFDADPFAVELFAAEEVAAFLDGALFVDRPLPAAVDAGFPMPAEPDFDAAAVFFTVFPALGLFAALPVPEAEPPVLPDLGAVFLSVPVVFADDGDFDLEVLAFAADPDLAAVVPDALDLEELRFEPVDPADFAVEPALDPPVFLSLATPAVLATAEAVPTAAPLTAPSAAPWKSSPTTSLAFS